MTDFNRRLLMKALGGATIATSISGNISFAQASDAFDKIPRIKLTTLPTALNKMNNLTNLVDGPDLYVKRDDVMELAHGGNKTRKLEFGLAEALNNGAKAVVTQGGLQSNHVRQTCSGAAKFGLEAHVVLNNPVPEMKEALMGSGNYLMDELMGAHIYLAEEGRGPLVDKVIAKLTNSGKRPYNIPAGASNGIGSLGYMDAAREMIMQWDEMGLSPSHIITATGSCGTQAGLLMGLRYFGNTTTQVVGVSVAAPAARLQTRVREVINMITDVTGISGDIVKDDEIIVVDEYIGTGYGRPTEAGMAAIRLLGEKEGIILDPVYSGKGMSGLLDLIKNNKLEDAKDVVFLHTGGAPTIHAYSDHF